MLTQDKGVIVAAEKHCHLGKSHETDAKAPTSLANELNRLKRLKEVP